MPTLLLCFVLTELALRFVVPASEPPYAYFDPNERIFRFDTQKQREGTFTTGKLANIQGRWRINNYGWNSQRDYEPAEDRDKPLIAVIGDSYVEAIYLDTEDHFAALLHQRLDGAADVYSFGISGAPLSQYLHLSRYVARHFDPDVFVFSIVHNDFDESLYSIDEVPYLPKPWFLQLAHKQGPFSEVEPRGYTPSPMKRLARNSALVRYLYLNLKIENTWAQLFDRSEATTGMKGIWQGRDIDFDSNIDVAGVLSIQDLLAEATSYVVSQIRTEHPGRTIIFMIDAPRNDIYQGTLAQSRVKKLNDMLRRVCLEESVDFIDLTEAFLERYDADGNRFEWETNWHWNEHGHRVVAEVLYQHLVEGGLLAQPEGILKYSKLGGPKRPLITGRFVPFLPTDPHLADSIRMPIMQRCQ